jgi:UDP-N-acetylmuramoyl-L-alanyl-D-glutamate--2,6-diaminopimelate ligase
MCPPAPEPKLPAPRLPAPPEWSRRLLSVGVTGTNGKTSTTALIASALRQLAAPVPRVTTVGAYLDEELLDLPQDYAGFLAAMRAGLERGARFAALELTSEALALGFARAWPCQIGVFTNLTHDHLDAHGSPEHYLASKAQLFVQLPPGGSAVLNAFDPASELLREVVPQGVRLVRYGASSRAPTAAAAAREPMPPEQLPSGIELRAKRIELGWQGTRIELDPTGELGASLAREGVHTLTLQAIGHVYAENALAALGAALCAGVPARLAATGLGVAPRLAGRFEPVAERPYVVVDYAHSPDALERTLGAARELCRGRLWVVFGAGGNRDQAKRPLMGQAASLADRVVLTSDNPRDEDPGEIAAAVRAGIAAGIDVALELDRARAIRVAVLGAAADDVVVVAGKGHETTQESHGERRAFSDRRVVRAALGLDPTLAHPCDQAGGPSREDLR